MHRGRIVQIGTPADLYDRPTNAFVAGFIGESSLVEGTVAHFGRTEHALLPTGGGPPLHARASHLPEGARAMLLLRPERVAVHTDTPGGSGQSAEIVNSVYVGDVTRLLLRLQGGAALNAKYLKSHWPCLARTRDAGSRDLGPARRYSSPSGRLSMMEDTVMTTAAKLSRRRVLLGAGVSVAATGPFFHVTPAKADKGELVVVGWGGSRAAAMREVMFQPFERATGIRVRDDGPPEAAKVKAMVESGNVTWDILDTISQPF